MTSPTTEYRELLIGRGHLAQIDPEDYERASKLSWNLDNNGYPRAHIKNGYSDRVRGVLRKRPMIRLHQLVMNSSKGDRYDHIDGNPLNNQKSNLRLCTQQENTFNRKASKGRAFKGTEKTSSTKWRASLRYNGKIIRKGPYLSEIDAARGYNELAIKYYGSFARLNILEDKL